MSLNYYKINLIKKLVGIAYKYSRFSVIFLFYFYFKSRFLLHTYFTFDPSTNARFNLLFTENTKI